MGGRGRGTALDGGGRGGGQGSLSKEMTPELRVEGPSHAKSWGRRVDGENAAGGAVGRG